MRKDVSNETDYRHNQEKWFFFFAYKTTNNIHMCKNQKGGRSGAHKELGVERNHYKTLRPLCVPLCAAL